MKECKRCGYKKTWSGSDINCPFHKGDFFDENWNCGTIGRIRRICDVAETGEDYRLHYQYCDDQKYVIIKTDCIEHEDIDMGLCLFVTWYKSRGATDEMWIMSSNGGPVRPTYQQLHIIADFYNIKPVV